MFWQELANLFTGMTMITALVLIIGIIFCLIEVFTAGFGFFGIVGILALIAGVVIRILLGASLIQALMLISLIVIVLVLAVLIMISSAKHGLLSKTPLILKDTVLPSNYNKPNALYGKLVGKKGLTVTDCRPVGKIQIDEKDYEVVSIRGYLDKGIYVEVVEVDGTKISVKPL